MVNDELTSQKSSKKGLFLVIGAAIALLVSVFFVYTKISNPKSIFIKSINKEYAKFEKKLDSFLVEKKDLKSFIVSDEMNFKLDIDKSLLNDETNKMIEEINKLSIKDEIGMDLKNKKMLFTLNTLYGKDDLLNIGAYVVNEKAYFELKGLYDKYIEIPVDGFNELFEMGNSTSLSKDDLKYLLSKTKDAVINNLDSKKFKKSSAKITVNKKEIKANKITYTLTNKSFNELAVKALEDIKGDSKYIKILAKSTGLDEKEIKEELTNAIKNVKESKSEVDDDTKINISVYTKGLNNKSAGLDFEVVSEGESYKIAYYINGKEKELKLMQGKETFVSATIIDNKATIRFNAQGQELVLNVTKKEEKNKITYDYDINIAGAKLSGKVILDTIKDNKDGSGEVKVTVTASMMGIINLEVSDHLKIEYTDEIKLPDTSNSISYDELSEDDYNSIMEKLYNNEAFKSLMQGLMSYQEEMY